MTIVRLLSRGPEFRDLPVTVLFMPYTPERRIDFGGGFYDESGCSHRGEPPCKSRPDFLLRTNIAENGACFDHLTEVLEDMIAAAQRSGGDHDEQPGLLYRAVGPKRRPTEWQHVDYDHATIVYETRIDRSYELRVFRSKQSERIGVLVLREANKPPLFERPVLLAYGSAFGPDAEDVEKWREMAIEALDAQKSPRQVLDETLARRQAAQRKLYRILRSSVEAQQAFLKARETFADADNALRWMLQPNAVFQGQTPAENVDVKSLPKVLELIESIRAWDLRMAARASSQADDE